MEAPRKRRTSRPRAGFTLIELMIVVAVMAILASIAMPKFADLLHKAEEGGTKGNLGSLRSSLSIYYADNQGVYPQCPYAAASTVFPAIMVPKYGNAIPTIKNGLHPPVNTVYCDVAMVPGSVHDGQGWYYNADPADSAFGSLNVACDHTDSKGTSWTDY